MAQVRGTPPFPSAPGSWLSNFRFRADCKGNGKTLTPEDIGDALGVSGRTVRRWESGESVPNPDDLEHFAQACRLSALEAEFLSAAFEARESEQPPSQAAFRAQAAAVLDDPFPAVIVDSLFYIRAWNVYADILSTTGAFTTGSTNIVTWPLRVLARDGDTPLRQERISRWLIDFWLATAHLCGTPQYQQTLRELCEVPGFEERWRQIPLERRELLGGPTGSPYTFTRPDIGTYRVFPARITLPPTYHLREYVPLDDLARQTIERHPTSGDIGYADRWHWAA